MRMSHAADRSQSAPQFFCCKHFPFFLFFFCELTGAIAVIWTDLRPYLTLLWMAMACGSLEKMQNVHVYTCSKPTILKSM